MYNLIEEAWIPVRRASGTVARISPSDVTNSDGGDPVIAFGSSRADFDGALAQFMVGLLQLVATPSDEDDWLQWFEHPPSRDELHAAFTRSRDAFDLLGEGPRFLQDTGLDSADDRSVETLLIDAPGGATLKKNTDLFVKRHDESAICLPCIAAALLTLQTNAPSGGRGHRVSLRGGGPMTTMLVADDLWHTLWLNVLSAEEWESAPSSSVDPRALLWMGPCPTSEKKEVLTPEEAHPHHVFWSMPRRILLGDPSGVATCSACGDEVEETVTSYGTKPHGPNYDGAWRHPLTPYRKQSDGVVRPVLGKPGTISYRHWLGLVQEDPDNDAQPAHVIHVYRTRRAGDIGRTFRLWAFGFDMDNMKARGWREGTMPLPAVCPERRERYESDARRLVLAANEIATALRRSMWRVLAGGQTSSKGDISFVTDSFWGRTEGPFLETLDGLRQRHETEADTTELRRAWLRTLRTHALDEFDARALGATVAADNVKTIAQARRSLRHVVYGSKVDKILDIPKTATEPIQT